MRRDPADRDRPHGGFRSWLVGRDSDCDIRVSETAVSPRHCLLTHEDGVFFITDLGSSSGTFVNGERIDEKYPIKPQDRVTLGRKAALPWPVGAASRSRVLRIGRSPENDVVLDVPGVSWVHAQLTQDSNGMTIEDLNSTYGTSLSERSNRIRTKTPVSPSDIVFLGSYRTRIGPLIGDAGSRVGSNPRRKS